jgi:hypothetical protein
MYTEERLKSEIIQEAMAKKCEAVSEKEMTLAAVLNKAVSVGFACQAFGVS